MLLGMLNRGMVDFHHVHCHRLLTGKLRTNVTVVVWASHAPSPGNTLGLEGLEGQPGSPGNASLPKPKLLR